MNPNNDKSYSSCNVICLLPRSLSHFFFRRFMFPASPRFVIVIFIFIHQRVRAKFTASRRFVVPVKTVYIFACLAKCDWFNYHKLSLEPPFCSQYQHAQRSFKLFNVLSLVFHQFPNAKIIIVIRTLATPTTFVTIAGEKLYLFRGCFHYGFSLLPHGAVSRSCSVG